MTGLNGKLVIPSGYQSALNLVETERAIKYVKDQFERELAVALNLTRVSAPLAVLNKTGLNDNLTGVEKPVAFSLKDVPDRAEIVQSLAKWKRMALAEYGFAYGEGLYTDMNALRPDETLDNLHSFYVDQWDWERVMRAEERNLDFLRWIVRRIYTAIVDMERVACKAFPALPRPYLPEEIHFVHSEELIERYPHLTPKERENAICREKGAVFVIGIGAQLADGQPHDLRAPDYDDWTTETVDGRRGLNGDILVWYPVLNCALELSSMGIRVDKTALIRQLELQGATERVNLYFHRRLLGDDLPLTVGGGIGQSRLCMLYLRKAHVGEVQSSIWPETMVTVCREAGIRLL